MDIDNAIYKFKSFWNLLGEDGRELRGLVIIEKDNAIYTINTTFFLKENTYQQYEITLGDLEDFKQKGIFLKYSCYNTHFQDFSFANGNLVINCGNELKFFITDVKITKRK